MPSKTTVLLVESEMPLRTELAKELGKQGITAIEARDAAEGLALAEDHLPDLILIDAITLTQDGMDGQALLMKLRTRDWCEHVPILFVDGIAADEKIPWGTPENPTFYYEKEAMNLAALSAEIKKQLKEAAIIS